MLQADRSILTSAEFVGSCSSKRLRQADKPIRSRHVIGQTLSHFQGPRVLWALLPVLALAGCQSHGIQRADREVEGTVMGMNHPDATQKPQFLLNVMHWLSNLAE